MTEVASASSASSIATHPSGEDQKVLDIQIISDNICPFCALGKKKIEAAVAQLPKNIRVNYDWRPFALDETLPKPGVNKMQRYEAKFGASRIEGMLKQMKQNGLPYGINFSYGGKVGNTLDSHRLIEWSKTPEQGGGKHTDALINSLFTGYFEQERDISDDDTLIELWTRAGLPATADEVRAFLKSDRLRKEVHEEIQDARNASVSGVPHFIIGGKYAISGAQEPNVFLHVFKKLGYTS
jgi:predicted DsbA family dithiol-disulfide isomerase